MADTRQGWTTAFNPNLGRAPSKTCGHLHRTSEEAAACPDAAFKQSQLCELNAAGKVSKIMLISRPLGYQGRKEGKGST